MRSPERIDGFCDRLAAAWKKYPDFRFSQMFMNIMGISAYPNVFYAEDGVVIERIEAWMSEFVDGDRNYADK